MKTLQQELGNTGQMVLNAQSVIQKMAPELTKLARAFDEHGQKRKDPAGESKPVPIPAAKNKFQGIPLIPLEELPDDHEIFGEDGTRGLSKAEARQRLTIAMNPSSMLMSADVQPVVLTRRDVVNRFSTKELYSQYKSLRFILGQDNQKGETEIRLISMGG